MLGSSGCAVVLLVFVVTIHWSNDVDGELSGKESVDDTEQQLDRLTARLERLTNKLDQTLQDNRDVEDTAKMFLRRMGQQEGKNGVCDMNHFPCSYGEVGAVQCVRNYLLCDGTPDCRNGADESPEICELPFRDAVVMPTVVTKDECRTVPSKKIKEQEPFGWAINAAKVIPWFPSRPYLSWKYMIQIDTGEAVVTNEFTTGAVYDYATRSFLTEFNPNHYLIGPCWLDISNRTTNIYICELKRPYDGEKDRGCFISVAALKTS